MEPTSREHISRILLAALEETAEGFYNIDKIAERSRVSSESVRRVLSRFGGEKAHRIILAVAALKAGCEPSKVVRNLTWREMEDFAREIGGRAGYQHLENIYFGLGGRRFQIDLILWRYRVILVVDCKRWKKPLAGETLRSVSLRHEDRCRALAKYLEATIPGNNRVSFQPVVVSVYEPSTRLSGITHVVPVDTLINYLNTFDYGYSSGGISASLHLRWSELLKAMLGRR
ncbi:hypothetical protein HRbin01_01516 [archaeon HR01]|nr:hypothetical protein HRbin01_01516 [archaeon HR01]